MHEVDVATLNLTGRVRIDPDVSSDSRDVFVNKLRKESQVSLSSVSDCFSDDSEDYEAQKERKISLEEITKKAEDKKVFFKIRGRSMSDGEATQLINDDPHFQVFPSLPNSVLEKLGLHGDGPREHMNEEELEQKYTSLALAFTIDATTIKDRCERQRKSRDQTEKNLNMEIDKLREKLTLMQPLCKDYEKAEILSAIMRQMDIIMNAASLASISAERFGSVQHEDRLTGSVGLIVNHVQMLKQQRDLTKKQLQYTKQVLQNSANSPSGISSSPTNNSLSPLSSNLKIVSARRASIPAFTEQRNDTSPHRPVMEIKTITRRVSDLAPRSRQLIRRSTRFELGGELVKIKEGCLVLSNESEIASTVENEEMHVSPANVTSPEDLLEEEEVDLSVLSIRQKIIYKYGLTKQSVEDVYNAWVMNGRLHEVCTFCAIVCFSLSIVLLVNIFTEYEYAKRGILSQ